MWQPRISPTAPGWRWRSSSRQGNQDIWLYDFSERYIDPTDVRGNPLNFSSVDAGQRTRHHFRLAGRLRHLRDSHGMAAVCWRASHQDCNLVSSPPGLPMARRSPSCRTEPLLTTTFSLLRPSGALRNPSSTPLSTNVTLQSPRTAAGSPTSPLKRAGSAEFFMSSRTPVPVAKMHISSVG